MSMKLYIGNLSFKTSKEDLQKLFSKAGTVESARVIEDREAGRSRGFGFVEIGSVSEEGDPAEGQAILLSTGEDLKGIASVLTKDEEAEGQIKYYLTEIAESRKRARKTQTEINRLKKKTQAILDKLS